MSWSVSASGSIPEVKSELARQFSHPLADPPGGITDEGERETVRRMRDTIFQILDTFGPERAVRLSASGHMGYEDWGAKTGAYQNVSLSIST